MRTPAPRTTRSGAVARAADRFVIGDIRAVEKARCRERGVAQRRAAADSMLICPAENKMTKHHVPGSRTRGEPVTRDSSRYRYVGENKTLRENRAGARARRPGTIESLASRGARSRPGCLRLSRLTDKTLNRKHYCGAKKGHRQRFPTMVTKTHASEGQGVGRAGPVRCARFWSWQMTRDQEFKPLLSRCAVSAVWGLRM